MTAPLQEKTLAAQLADGSLAGTWTLDPARSTVALKSKAMWGLSAVKGTFTDVTGAGAVSPTGEVTGQITVATASLDTKNARRDKHLRRVPRPGRGRCRGARRDGRGGPVTLRPHLEPARHGVNAQHHHAARGLL